MKRKKVLIYYTGGTIGMTATTPRDADPEFPNRVATELAGVGGLPEWDFVRRPTLLDSSDMTPWQWHDIAGYIVSRRNDYDAFVVLHGTDTMAYTTSALTFMIGGLVGKPIVFTGSQVPLAVQPRECNDARDNLINSLRIAGDDRLAPVVSLFFKNKLLLGCRATKVDASDWDAFDSPNADPLARVTEDGIEFSPFSQHEVLPLSEDPDGAPEVQAFTRTEVGLLRLFPGISGEITRNFLQSPLKGAVLHAYGSGNGPSRRSNPSFRDALRDAVSRRGVVIVACTQCLRGNVNLSLYQTGLGDDLVISGFDMTAEAAVTKLFWLLSRNLGRSEVERQMQLNLRGELTLPTPPLPCP